MKGLFGTLTILGIISLVLVSVVSIQFWYSFKTNCGDYLKLAGDAPTVERANEFLDKAISYLERENKTSGNSALIFHTPANDVGVWYGQLKAAKQIVEQVLNYQPKASEDPNLLQVNKSNALMKVRETVLDQGENGVSVTKPAHITWYPNQWGMTIWWWVTVIWTIVFCICFLAVSDWF
jgi:hypothetical protein